MNETLHAFISVLTSFASASHYASNESAAAAARAKTLVAYWVPSHGFWLSNMLLKANFPKEWRLVSCQHTKPRLTEWTKQTGR